MKNDQPSQDALAATQRGVQDFQNSPEVGALLQAAATYHALPNGHLRLQFPPEFGGTREYDADQVQLLTGFAPGVLDRLVFGDRLPTHALVASCREQYPQFAQTFDAYDKIIDFMQSKIDAINQLNQAVQTGR